MLPEHTYYEKENLEGLLINRIKDFEEYIEALDRLLSRVNNWATCDLLKPVSSKKATKDQLLPHVRRWLASEHVYTCRFGVGVLMNYYLDEAFEPRFLEWVGEICSEEYYVNMGIAWYFATALAKQWEEAVKWVEEGRLMPWEHNKSIQKAVESYRVTKEQKEYLKKLKK